MVLAVLVVASFALSVTETARSAPWAYFGPHTRAWELGAGALVALGATRLRRLPAVTRAVARLGRASAAIMLAARRYGDATAYPGWRAVLPVAGAVAVIAAGGRRRRRPLLAVRPMQVVGRLSYCWYLWHWPVLLIGPAALGLRGTVGQKLLLAAAALVLAWATYRWVENPLRHRPALRDRARRGLGLGAALSGAVAAAAVLVLVLPHAVPAGGRRPDLSATLAAARRSGGRAGRGDRGAAAGWGSCRPTCVPG